MYLIRLSAKTFHFYSQECRCRKWGSWYLSRFDCSIMVYYCLIWINIFQYRYIYSSLKQSQHNVVILTPNCLQLDDEKEHKHSCTNVTLRSVAVRHFPNFHREDTNTEKVNTSFMRFLSGFAYIPIRNCKKFLGFKSFSRFCDWTDRSGMTIAHENKSIVWWGASKRPFCEEKYML